MSCRVHRPEVGLPASCRHRYLRRTVMGLRAGEERRCPNSRDHL